MRFQVESREARDIVGCVSEIEVTFAVPAIEPQMADVLVIDGAEHVMKDLRPIPAAGTAVAYVAFVAV